jgi:hypothetical protein
MSYYPYKAIKQENLQLAVFTAFNILASYKFPLIEALVALFVFIMVTCNQVLKPDSF